MIHIKENDSAGWMPPVRERDTDNDYVGPIGEVPPRDDSQAHEAFNPRSWDGGL